jgi:hypothetical protein
MKLSAPKQITFVIAVLLFVVAIIFNFGASVEPYAIWVALVSFVVLAAGNLFEGI